MTKKAIKDDLRVFVVPVDILKADLTSAEKLVYIVLRSFVNPHKNEAFPSYQLIANLASMSRRNVIRVMESLLEKGLLEKESRYNFDPKKKKVRQSSNLYTLKSPQCHDVTNPSDKMSPTQCHDVTNPSDKMSPNHNHLDHNHLIDDDDIVAIAHKIKEDKFKDLENERLKTVITRIKQNKANINDLDSYIITALQKEFETQQRASQKSILTNENKSNKTTTHKKRFKAKIEAVKNDDIETTDLTPEELAEIQQMIKELDGVSV